MIFVIQITEVDNDRGYSWLEHKFHKFRNKKQAIDFIAKDQESEYLQDYFYLTSNFAGVLNFIDEKIPPSFSSHEHLFGDHDLVEEIRRVIDCELRDAFQQKTDKMNEVNKELRRKQYEKLKEEFDGTNSKNQKDN